MSNPIKIEFVGLGSATAKRNPAGFSPCQGLYFRPADTCPEIAFIASHYNVDFSEHYLAPLLANRGFGFLGWNTRFRGNEPWFLLEHALIDIAAGVNWLRQSGVKTVVLLGNSGGGSLMAAYQSQASDPNIKAIMADRFSTRVETALSGFNAADLYVSLNAHGGRPEVLTDWMDPSVVDEFDPLAIDESLNMYNPENQLTSATRYSEDFVRRYRAAQSARNNRISDWVVEELARVNAKGVRERIFTLPRVWADLRLIDGSIDPSARDLGVCYAGDAKQANFDARGIANSSSLLSWLSMWSLKYSQCRSAQHLPRITVPSLVIQSLADTGVYPSDAKMIFELLACVDKTLKFVPGDHYCLDPPETRDQVADIIAAWVKSRLG